MAVHRPDLRETSAGGVRRARLVAGVIPLSRHVISTRDRRRRTRLPRGTPSSSSPPLTGCAYVYLLRCRDRTFYTGWTTDLDRRIARHQAGTGARYTRSRLPVELVYAERLSDCREARRREWTLRRLSHHQKAALTGRVDGPRGRERARSEAAAGTGWPRVSRGRAVTGARRSGEETIMTDEYAKRAARPWPRA